MIDVMGLNYDEEMSKLKELVIIGMTYFCHVSPIYNFSKKKKNKFDLQQIGVVLILKRS